MNKTNKKSRVMTVPLDIKSTVNQNNRKKIKNVRFDAGINMPSTMDNAVASRAKAVVNKMQSTPELSVDGIGFIQHSLNPCGEHTVPNSRCTDGTLSQSAVQTLRAEDFVVPPFTNTSTIADTTKNWTLIEISVPAYTAISLFIASADASQPTNAQYRSIFTQINSTGIADYPAWTSIGTTNVNFYASYWRYESSKLDYDVASNQSTSVESFRFVGDGIVVNHNCPTLWDQGGFVTGQFQCDSEYFSQPGAIAGITVQASSVVIASNQVTFTGLNVAQTLGEINFLNVNGNTVIANNSTVSITNVLFPFVYNIRKPDGNFLVNVAANAVFQWVVGYTSSNSSMTLSTPTTVGGPLTIPLVTGPLAYADAYTTTPSLGAEEATASVIIDLPSLDWSTIVQADPKRASALMKSHKGFYSVRRFFQPKLLMQKSNQSGNIKFSVQGMDRLAIVQAKGGIKDDLVDRNGAIRVSVLRGLSYAAQPQIKADRFIELMPAPGSILASVTEVTPARDEDAEEIFRSLQARGAHAYVPDANFLGFLAGFLSSLVSKLPMYLRTVRAVSSAVEHAAEWAESKTKFLE